MDCYGKNMCKGILCHTFKKEVQCFHCGVWLCKVCDIKVDGKTYCLDCLIRLPFRKIDSIMLDGYQLPEKPENKDFNALNRIYKSEK